MSAEHIHHRVNQQMSTRERIQTAYTNLLKIGRNNLTITRIQNRIEAVEEQWHQFDLNHQAIELALSQVDFHTRNTIKERSYFISGLYNSTYETYLETTEMMKDVLQEKSSRPTTSVSSGQQMEEGSTSFMGPIQRQQPRLPRIDLPKFNGTSSEWLSFKGLYISLVYSNQFIDDVAKLQYLKTSLIGPAAFLLKGTDLIAENFQPAWDTVLAFYENERRLVNSSLKMLFAQKKMTKDSSKELESLYMSFNEVYRTLESLNRPVQYYDDFLDGS